MLYIVPTPIGNLKDITLRALEVLKEVDLILCEDTRNSIKLLNHYGIKKPLLSYHKFNEKIILDKILDKLKNCEKIALISDAGMPGISDPGEILINECVKNEIEYSVLPGASASITALVASNLEKEKFLFYGFLDRHKISKQLIDLKNIKYSIVFYESPHRILKTLESMLEILGNRKVFIIREISKIYETKYYFNLKEAVDFFSLEEAKGEFVIVLEGQKNNDVVMIDDIIEEAIKKLNSGSKIKEISKEFSEIYGINKNEIYKKLIELKDNL